MFNYLVEQESNIITTKSTVILHNNILYYIPAKSSALHIAVLVHDEQMMERLL